MTLIAVRSVNGFGTGTRMQTGEGVVSSGRISKPAKGVDKLRKRCSLKCS